MVEKILIYPRLQSLLSKQLKGITTGTTSDSETTNKVFYDADIRMIDDNYANRELAYKLDALARLVVAIQKFAILGNYDLKSENEQKDRDAINQYKDWIESIGLMASFRQSYDDIKIHGRTAFQILHESSDLKLEGEGNKIKGLQQLVDLKKRVNPFDSTDYYYYQKLNVLDDWKNPEDTKATEKKVWYIQGGKENAGAYPKIATDRVVDRAEVVEILNNESGDSSLSACLNEIFIKNLVLIQLPNLVMLVVAPILQITYHKYDTQGNKIIPDMPTADLQSTDPETYTRMETEYTNFQNNLQSIVNDIADNYYLKGIPAKPDWIDLDVVESDRAINPEMLERIITAINTEICYALGFPLALLDARGAELATTRSIKEIISGTLRGIQAQYELIAEKILYEAFPDAKARRIKFKLSELDPQDKKVLAEVKRLLSEVLVNMKKLGASDEDLKTLAAQMDLAEDLKLGGAGLQQTIQSGILSQEEIKAFNELQSRIEHDQEVEA